MFKIHAALVAAVVALGMPQLSHATVDAELQSIRDEIKQLKQNYETRIEELEKRLHDAETKAAQAEASAAQAQTATVTASARPASESAFNPAISAVLQGTYNNFSQNPDTFQIGGFIPPGNEGLGDRGFSLGETELNIAANIDPYFRGNLTLALSSDNSVELEEAWFQTLGLSNGFTLKGGRFFSGVGYLNEIHQHAWDFVDAPLAYQVFLGTGPRGNYSDDGLQLKWIAPTDLFIELGAEAGNGNNFPGTGDKNGIGTWSLFSHMGGDIGDSYAYRAGISYLQAWPSDRQYNDTDSAGNPVTNSFSGNSRLWIGDFVLKWAPNGNSTSTNFKLQGEYMHRIETGILDFNANSAAQVPGTYDSHQSGWYLQGVYQFLPRWRVGLRRDQLESGTVNIGQVQNGILPASDFPILKSYTPKRNTLMFDYSPSEFSRFRLQYARDQSRPDGVDDNELMLQYIFSMGAHGAHKF
ncbi:MAG TPA: hypothetical protein VK460_01300 [Burkholderiales bacterium]|nr:hypothetical protein [Burkholderiales bacterium]